MQFFFFFTSINNYCPLLSSALSNPGFLFSERAHVFHFNTAQVHQGSLLPWVISSLKKSLVMPPRKPHLKIHVGVGCPQTHPGTAGRDCVRLGGCSEHTVTPSLPAHQGRRSSLSASVSSRTPGTPATGCSQWPDSRSPVEEGWGQAPQRPLRLWLDWNTVPQEFDSLYKVHEDKIPSLSEGLYLKGQFWG